MKLHCDPESNSTRLGIKLPIEFSILTIIAVGNIQYFVLNVFFIQYVS